MFLTLTFLPPSETKDVDWRRATLLGVQIGLVSTSVSEALSLSKAFRNQKKPQILTPSQAITALLNRPDLSLDLAVRLTEQLERMRSLPTIPPEDNSYTD
ncbi:hypothetical protein [Argonema antarcticum]|uniref:hypothetical protein n=1 Tax=Argonema antarcticum TaxID=2942763 RepID=UPI0020124D39|nr:hypothetical protein [Argonema antarcticum]MCL1474705.1 hypothetical protein [Argonema antarcticum A004/B2]